MPGAVAGFCEAQAKYGRLALERVLAPAIEAADAGVDFKFSDRLGVLDRVPEAEPSAETLSVLMPGGRFPRGGGGEPPDRMDTRPLARTLRLIARKGPGGFYRGRVAAAIERHVRGAGGLLGRDDLAAYRPRIPLEPPLRYRGHDYVSCYDQVAYEALNVLERFDIAGVRSRQLPVPPPRRRGARARVHRLDGPLRRPGLRREPGARTLEPGVRCHALALHPLAPRPPAAGDAR